MISSLTPKLLEGLVCGNSTAIHDEDLIDLRNSVRITNHERLSNKEELLVWFFDGVKAFSPAHR